jgi:hypothetical protein
MTLLKACYKNGAFNTLCCFVSFLERNQLGWRELEWFGSGWGRVAVTSVMNISGCIKFGYLFD